MVRQQRHRQTLPYTSLLFLFDKNTRARAVLADLLGPANGPEELVDERYVRDRYLVGRLGPQGQSRLADDEAGPSVDDLEGELAVAGVDDEDGATEERMAYAPSMQPASLGLSFVVDGQARALHITVRWGRYVREAGPA